MKRMTFILLAILLLTMPQWATIAPTAAAGPVEVADCLFFTETGGEEGGFLVCDNGHVGFRSAFERWGLQKIGYPISQRYVHDGFVTQAFQKAIMQWRVESGTVVLVNIFDDLHKAGFDETLLSVRQTPRQLPAGWDGDIPFDEVVKKRQALLAVRPALEETYFASSDPLTFYGLPTSEVEDMGNHYAVRLQRAVLQEWKEEVPWAKEGQVTIANGGDIAKELGGLPAEALIPEKVVALPSSASTFFHHPNIADVAWANDHTLAVAAGDGIWLYDTNALDSGPQLLSEKRCLPYESRCLLITSHNGEWLALRFGGVANLLLLWSLTSLGEPKVLADYPIPLSFSDLAISPNGKSVAFNNSSPPYHIYLWDAASGDVKRLYNEWGLVTPPSFTSDSAVVMVGIQTSEPGELQGAIRRWNVSNGEDMDALSVQLPIAFSPDGQTAATRGPDFAKLWDLSSEPITSRKFGAPLSPDSDLFAFAFNQDSSKLAAAIGSSSNVSNTEVWDLSTESKVGTIPNGLAWSPPGPGPGRFATFSDPFTTNYDCWLWDVTQNKRLAILARLCPAITFSPNDRWLASANGQLLQLSNIESLLEIGQPQGIAPTSSDK
ncbi:MAG: WD40 repeat domain-containing protein [Ardenticatenaceae bacterium]